MADPVTFPLESFRFQTRNMLLRHVAQIEVQGVRLTHGDVIAGRRGDSNVERILMGQIFFLASKVKPGRANHKTLLMPALVMSLPQAPMVLHLVSVVLISHNALISHIAHVFSPTG